MAKNILNSGFPLTVYNRTRARTAALAEAGAQVADTPGALAAQVDFVCSCITGPQDVAEVYLGDDGVVANARPGAVLVEMSTIDPGTHRQLAAGRCRARGGLPRRAGQRWRGGRRGRDAGDHDGR